MHGGGGSKGHDNRGGREGGVAIFNQHNNAPGGIVACIDGQGW